MRLTRVPSSTEENTRLKSLRADYKGAFDEWALQVSRLQDVTSASQASAAQASATQEGCAVKKAEARVTAAQVEYRDTRDRLIDGMSARTDVLE